jgi:thiol:disulfide interchange protein DsbD
MKFFIFVSLLFAVNPNDLVKIGKIKNTTQENTVVISVPLTIEKGFHIQANNPGNKRFIATTFEFEKNSPIEVVSVEFPEGKEFKIQSSPEPVKVYEGKIDILAKIKLTQTQKKLSLNAKLRYQACDDKNCFFPVNKELKINLK